MDLPREGWIFLFSLSALGVLYTMNNVPAFQEPFVILEIGVAVLVAVFLLVFLAVRHRPPKDPLFYVFAEFSFTCIIDLTSALEYDGFASGFMEFYRTTGEPYLGTAYAIMMCYWDGIVHFLLYLIMVRRMANKKPYRSMGIFWAGSLFANMIVFVPGIVLGKYGSEIRPAFWLNMPFLFVPIGGAIALFRRQRELPSISTAKIERDQRKSLFSRPLDMLLIILLLGAIGVTLFRGFVALNCPLDVCFTYINKYEPYLKDPVAYPRVMMLLFLFYATPLLAVFTYGLRTPGCTWMLDWTVFFAGAAAQCQWSHIGASLHPRTAFMYRIPKEAWWPVIALNLLYAGIPQILALRCTRSPSFFMKPVPEGQGNHEKKYT
ncbi:transmembrane 6 superfamily member 2 [Megalops cyprinoides]|uniref:transmembrane 6 superfamily member 2 n=1 Tax=Megalops cyprinoides TaxID=118141 RepID=UPI001865111E|nr:transmembrane 6 superfamily member 2 [Megalops cyprinoides]